MPVYVGATPWDPPADVVRIHVGADLVWEPAAPGAGDVLLINAAGDQLLINAAGDALLINAEAVPPAGLAIVYEGETIEYAGQPIGY